MAVTHEAATRNAIADDFLDHIGPNAAYLKFETSGDAEISRHDFPSPSGTVTAATLNFTCGGGGIADTSPATTGTVVQASLYNATNTKIFECTAAETGGDITISSASINVTDTVTLTALSWEAPLIDQSGLLVGVLSKEWKYLGAYVLAGICQWCSRSTSIIFRFV